MSSVPTLKTDDAESLRKSLLEKVRKTTRAEFASFFRCARVAGAPHYSALAAVGCQDITKFWLGFEGQPLLPGAIFAKKGPTGVRRGDWKPASFSQGVRPGFRSIEQDYCREALTRTDVWQRVYAPFSFSDQLRLVPVAHGARILGWVAAVRRGRWDERFTIGAQLAADALVPEVHSVLLAAEALETKRWPTAQYVQLNAGGQVLGATEGVSAWLDRSRMHMLGSAVRRADRDDLVSAFVDGVDIRLVRMVQDGSTTYLAVMTSTEVAAATLGFTSMQRRVAQLAAEGHSATAIGDELGISSNTVKFHLKAAYRTLGVTNRLELRQALEASGDVKP